MFFLKNFKISSHAQGLFLMVLGMFIFTTVNAILKFKQQHYPIFQIVFMRNLFALIPFSFLLFTYAIPLRTAHFPTHIWRGVAGSISHCCLFISILLLPFTDANVLSFTTTFIVCLLSFFILKEKLAFSGWFALAIGFLGVTVIARPSSFLEGFASSLGVLCALVSTFFEGLVMVHNRLFKEREVPLRMTFYYATVAVVTMGLAIIFYHSLGYTGWVPLTLNDALIFALFGIGGGLGQACVTVAYTKTRANILAPLIYTAILWSTMYSVLLFHEPMTLTFYLGTFLIIGSGLFIVTGSERTLRRKCV